MEFDNEGNLIRRAPEQPRPGEGAEGETADASAGEGEQPAASASEG
jgi:hypothetical protein